jgi:hypothetical protein
MCWCWGWTSISNPRKTTGPTHVETDGSYLLERDVMSLRGVDGEHLTLYRQGRSGPGSAVLSDYVDEVRVLAKTRRYKRDHRTTEPRVVHVSPSDCRSSSRLIHGRGRARRDSNGSTGGGSGPGTTDRGLSWARSYLSHSHTAGVRGGTIDHVPEVHAASVYALLLSRESGQAGPICSTSEELIRDGNADHPMGILIALHDLARGKWVSPCHDSDEIIRHRRPLRTLVQYLYDTKTYCPHGWNFSATRTRLCCVTRYF